jgi:hypothetical protein
VVIQNNVYNIYISNRQAVSSNLKDCGVIGIIRKQEEGDLAKVRRKNEII